MKKLKFIFAVVFLFVIAFLSGFSSPFYGVASASSEIKTPVNKNIYSASVERDYLVNLSVNHESGTVGDVNIGISFETNEDELKRFEKYTKKKIDAGDVGEVFYVTTTLTEPKLDEENFNRISYKFVVKLPEFYKNKEVVVIPFTDYRSAGTLKPVTVSEDGCIKFTGTNEYYAYAIVYNGVYKDIIMIGFIMLAVLAICVTVKILCIRRDDPERKEKLKQKEIEKKKQEHKLNKRLAQELKREKEKLKHTKKQ